MSGNHTNPDDSDHESQVCSKFGNGSDDDDVVLCDRNNTLVVKNHLIVNVPPNENVDMIPHFMTKLGESVAKRTSDGLCNMSHTHTRRTSCPHVLLHRCTSQ